MVQFFPIRIPGPTKFTYVFFKLRIIISLVVVLFQELEKLIWIGEDNDQFIQKFKSACPPTLHGGHCRFCPTLQSVSSDEYNCAMVKSIMLYNFVSVFMFQFLEGDVDRFFQTWFHDNSYLVLGKLAGALFGVVFLGCF